MTQLIDLDGFGKADANDPAKELAGPEELKNALMGDQGLGGLADS